jgi:uncharacterized lipoprotein YajG
MKLALPLLCMVLLAGCASNAAHVEFGLPASWPGGEPLVTVLPLEVKGRSVDSSFAAFLDRDGKLVNVQTVAPVSATQQVVPPELSNPFWTFLLTLFH